MNFSATFKDRFWAKIKKTDGCWLWTGSLNNKGYGEIGIGGRGSGTVYTHRASWILHFGNIPRGMCVLHNCPGGDNPACVNPDHLWLGTQSQNLADMDEKGRRRVVIGSSHPKTHLTETDVIRIRCLRREGATVKSLCEEYRVNSGTMSRICTRQSWKHV